MATDESLTDGLPAKLPEQGMGEVHALAMFQDLVNAHSVDLGAPTAFAHMDPPPADIAAQLVGLNAQYNQNLLHPDVSPFATQAEALLMDWLAPLFGMRTGHLCAGSTLANLTALWCAREHGAKQVVASSEAHLSIAKSAHILGLPLVEIEADDKGRMLQSQLPELANSALVLTAGTTGRGVIDELQVSGALWTHVDAAWAGPLMLTRYADRLAGIERADSVAISGHKWFYQPKDSAMVLFADNSAQDKVSFNGAYLSTPNVGIQGSRSAAAIPLLATLLAWGRQGLATRLEKSVSDSEQLASYIEKHAELKLRQWPETGVVNWKAMLRDNNMLYQQLRGVSSIVAGKDRKVWLRCVAANRGVEIDQLLALISACLGQR